MQRVQHDNQRQILGKLLHDLRNPAHSLRITIELFSRVMSKSGERDALIDRAARYIEPAESAVISLQANVERLSVYLTPPAAPAIVPVRVDELLTEIAVLLRDVVPGLQVDVQASANKPDAATELAADRPRLSHALLRHCLSNAGLRTSLSSRTDDEEVWIDADLGSAVREADPSLALFTTDELRVLIENAGGKLAMGEGRSVSVGFRRSR